MDKRPANSLRFAEIQADNQIKGTYFFRIVSQSFDEVIIKKISDNGHEIGYHYEDLSLVAKKFKLQKFNGNGFPKDLINEAINSFEENLSRLRNCSSVTSICMHGSPLSKYDSRDIWKYFDYRDYGILGEPYFDVDFSNVLYLTDTGRTWNNQSISIRDRVHKLQKIRTEPSESVIEFQSNYRFSKTDQIIQAAEELKLPSRIMITFHPQRWNWMILHWTEELVIQNLKNLIKYVIVYIRQK